MKIRIDIRALQKIIGQVGVAMTVAGLIGGIIAREFFPYGIIGGVGIICIIISVLRR